MKNLYVLLENGYVVDYEWNISKSSPWQRTIHGEKYEVDRKIYCSKFVDGTLVLDEALWEEHLIEQEKIAKEYKEQEQKDAEEREKNMPSTAIQLDAASNVLLSIMSSISDVLDDNTIEVQYMTSLTELGM